MPLHIRPLELGRDYPLAADLVKADPLEASRSASELEAMDSKLPRQCLLRTWIVEESGQAVGLISMMRAIWDVREGGILLRIHMTPAASLSALRSTYSFLMKEAKAMDGAFIVVWTRDDQTRRVQFFQDSGFLQVKRHAVTRLKVSQFFPDPYQPKITLLEKRGVEFMTGRQMSDQGMNVKAMVDAALEQVLREEYGFQGQPRPPYEKFVRRAAESQADMLDTSFFALHDGKVIGFTRLVPAQAEKGLWRTGLTGVLPSWRRRKVGTCVKVFSLMAAKEQGVEWVQTDNAEDTPTLHLNYLLGYKRTATLLEYERVMPKSLKDIPTE